MPKLNKKQKSLAKRINKLVHQLHREFYKMSSDEQQRVWQGTKPDIIHDNVFVRLDKEGYCNALTAAHNGSTVIVLCDDAEDAGTALGEGDQKYVEAARAAANFANTALVWHGEIDMAFTEGKQDIALLS